MQQAKGPIEQVNYTGTRKPSKSEQNWGQGQSSQSKSEQGQSSHQGKTDICQYCAGPSHPHSICPASNKRCSKKGCGRIGHFARACQMGAAPFAKTLEPVSTKHETSHAEQNPQNTLWSGFVHPKNQGVPLLAWYDFRYQE